MNLINLAIVASLYLFFTHPAHAYLDPGSGSFIFQLAVGAVLGSLVTIKFYYRKIKAFIAGIFHKKSKHDSDSAHK